MNIYKYELDPDRTQLYLPQGAEFLCVHEQGDTVQLWFLVNPKEPAVQRNFIARPTGQEFTPYSEARYLGSVFLYDASLVFHVFELL